MKILIVEDDFTSRNLLAEMVREYGTVHLAVSGKEAIDAYQAALQHEPYRLVFLDIILPGIHGDEILEIIRRTERLRGKEEIPAIIVITTADHTFETVKHSLKIGCDGYLVKPFDSDHIRTILLQKGLISE